MKIEMGESLLQSYLRYEKKCLVTQTNWKTSSQWQIEEEVYQTIQVMFDTIHNHADFSDVFKNGSLEQVLKQSELDVVGINNDKLYMVEVAFHENGLQYGDKQETKDRVCKKLLRAYLIGLALFPNFTYEIIFASPKVNHATDEIIKEYFSILEKDFGDGENISFRYLANEDFKDEILLPTLKSSLYDSDTSELFLRTAKMLEIFNLLDLSSKGKMTVRTNIGFFKPDENKNIHNDDAEAREICKVQNRLPRWFKHPEQNNSRILYAYLRLYDSNSKFVLYDDLKKESALDSNFNGNFDQMKNLGRKNHGKIFEQNGDKIYLWDKVKDFVLEMYEHYKE
ncbi:MAG: hypothetical protein K6E22_14535 [Treponema sp.]|nr:hypothetical protein [Treponema sp.]